MRIGILTYHRSQNYGAYMQAWALANAIQEQTGAQTELIDYNSPKSERFYQREIFREKNLSAVLYNWKKYRMFKREAEKLPLSREKLISDDLEKISAFLSGRYDAIVVGSDEIWKLDGFRGFPNAYWLPNVSGCAKLAYAASARNHPDEVTQQQRTDMESLLETFRFVGVRDGVTKELVDSVLPEEKKAVLVCDPTMAYSFAIDREKGRQLLKDKFHVDPAKKCLGIMVNKKQLAKKIVERYGDQVQIVSLFFSYPGTKSCPELTPFEWVQVIAALDGLITTFFHGMCFAINGDTPFMVIEQRNISEPRFSKSYDLLSRSGAEQFYYQANRSGNIEEQMDTFVQGVREGTLTADHSAIKKREQSSFDSFLNVLRSLDKQELKAE